MRVAVCWKWAPQRGTVNELTGEIEPDPRSFGPSPADEAALELALGMSSDVTVICAGPDGAIAMLRDALAAGATRAVHCSASADAPSVEVAATLAQAVGDASVVLCGDYSADRGSGSVPAFVAAQLGAAQALGCVAVQTTDSELQVERRLDRGRRERLQVGFPAVVSVEGSVARLRRAALSDVLAVKQATIETGPAVQGTSPLQRGANRPFRPRTRNPHVPFAGVENPLARVLEITQATDERTPPRLLTLEPPEAADAIMAQLGEWGYL